MSTGYLRVLRPEDDEIERALEYVTDELVESNVCHRGPGSIKFGSNLENHIGIDRDSSDYDEGRFVFEGNSPDMDSSHTVETGLNDMRDGLRSLYTSMTAEVPDDL